MAPGSKCQSVRQARCDHSSSSSSSSAVPSAQTHEGPGCGLVLESTPGGAAIGAVLGEGWLGLWPGSFRQGAVSRPVGALRVPLAEQPLHRLAAGPAAHVDRGDDLEGPQPLDKALHFQVAAVLAVGDACDRKERARP